MLVSLMTQIARDKECARMVWQVWDWNTKAIDFYKRLGGIFVPEVLDFRMYSPNLQELASSL